MNQIICTVDTVFEYYIEFHILDICHFDRQNCHNDRYRGYSRLEIAPPAKLSTKFVHVSVGGIIELHSISLPSERLRKRFGKLQSAWPESASLLLLFSGAFPGWELADTD